MTGESRAVALSFHVSSPDVTDRSRRLANDGRQQGDTAQHDPGGGNELAPFGLGRQVAIPDRGRRREVEVGEIDTLNQVFLARQRQQQPGDDVVRQQQDANTGPAESFEEHRGVTPK